MRDGTLRCTRCGAWKPPEAFKTRPGGCGRQAWCRRCHVDWKIERRRKKSVTTCRSCGKTLPWRLFPRKSVNRDERPNECKACAAEKPRSKKLKELIGPPLKRVRLEPKTKNDDRTALPLREIEIIDWDDVPIGAL